MFTTNLETDYLYFNSISCGSEQNCVVVAEGDDAAGNYLVVAYTTFDGGATWSQSLTASDVSLVGAKFVNANEVWLLGTSKSRANLLGQFYKSTDSGKSFVLAQSLDNCMGMDIDFGNEVGYASCLSSSGASCSAAMYV